MRIRFLVLLLALAAVPAGAVPARNVGPAIMGGRVETIAVVEANPDIIYIGAATGGVWKTENGGATWAPIFDHQGTTAIGAIAVSQRNPAIVWVGTGESNNRQSSSWGNGVWKSTDGGASWTSMGLADTHHIGGIVIDPRNPDVVYVAALGHLWGPNVERGLFKTTDGGRTWTNTKFIDEDTGFTDVVMDPSNPSVLYAAAYQRRRTPWGFSGGGPGSGLYKTTNAGRTWTRLEGGLPEGDLGKIGIDVFRRNPAIVYATVEHETEGGIYRSADRGRTWTKVNGLNPRPMYFSHIRIDPVNDQRIYLLAAPLYVSDDGGTTFRSDGARNVHVDHHALWIDPAEPSNLVLGNDGGVFMSRDAARTWTRVNNIPLGQFYTVSADMDRPYRLYGGLQDNGVWSGPSATWHRVGPLNDDWIQVAGGDGMAVAADPLDPGTAYVSTQNGRAMRFDVASGETRGIRPYEPTDAEDADPPGKGEPEPLDPTRFYWTSPLVVSAHNPRTLYIAGNRLWRSLDRGERWRPVSPDLTKQIVRDTLPIMGRVPDEHTLSKHDGVSAYGTATAFAESPVDPGLLMVGTDDGNVQITRDGGTSWREISARFEGLPARTPVADLLLSVHEAGRMFAAFDGHQQDDYRPHLFRSDDGGETWRPVGTALGTVVRSIAESPRNPDLLFVGLENGVRMSMDGGASWEPVNDALPDVPVYDLQIHPRDRDLILGSHGRSIYILPIDALERLTSDVRAEALHLFAPAGATEFRYLEHRDFLAQAEYVGANPPYGAAIDYWLRSETPDARLVIRDGDGEVVREIEAPGGAGLHRVVWDLRYAEPPQPPRPPATAGVVAGDPRPAESTAAAVPGDFGGGGDPTGGEAGEPRRPAEGPEVRPGAYRVTLRAGGAERHVTLRVDGDPRLSTDEAAQQARFELLHGYYELQRQVYPVQQQVAGVLRQVRATNRALTDADVPATLREAGEAAAKALGDAQSRLNRAMQQAGGAARDVEGSGFAPTAAQAEQFARAAARIPERLDAVRDVLATTVTAFARDVEQGAPATVPRISVTQPVP
ncbi:MAG: glycosyl hydrolase [Vicinamibacterales bacterium]